MLGCGYRILIFSNAKMNGRQPKRGEIMIISDNFFICRKIFNLLAIKVPPIFYLT